MKSSSLNKQDREDLNRYRALVAKGHKEFIPLVKYFENGKRRIYPIHRAKLMKQAARKLSVLNASGLDYDQMVEALQLDCKGSTLANYNNRPQLCSVEMLEQIVIQAVKYEHGYLR